VFRQLPKRRFGSARTAPTGRALRFLPRSGCGNFLKWFNGNLALILDNFDDPNQPQAAQCRQT